MIKIAEEFFKQQSVKVKQLEDFKASDLYLYFQKLFGELVYVEEQDESKHFFLSVQGLGGVSLDVFPPIYSPDEYVIAERIFYPERVGIPVGYFYPKTLEHLVGRTFRWDSSEKGRQLSKYGYLIHELDREDKEFLKTIQGFDYQGESNDKTKHLRYSSKYSNLDTTNKDIEYGKRLLRRAIPSCSFLNGMDYHQANFLYYPEGTTISPHNDVDVKSFCNIVLSSAVDGTKTTIIGEADWYRFTMEKLYFGGYDNKDIPDRKLLKRELYKFKPDGKSAIVFNFFNPKFYHEVPPTLSPCYTGLIFGTYRSIMEESDIDW